MNEIQKFIDVFSLSNPEGAIIEIFDNKCSYWFALILFRRFIRENATIMFDMKKNHFGTKISGKVYDITGDVTSEYVWKNWVEIEEDVKTEIVNKYIMF